MKASKAVAIFWNPYPLLCFLLFITIHVAQAGGVINNPTQADLEAALAGGGTAIFACNGTIVLTNTITISADTILDGSNYNVTISGGNALRIFQAASGVSFWVKRLMLSDGKVMAPNGADGSPPSPGEDALGGAILCQGGNLTLTDCTLSNNFVQGGQAGFETNPAPNFVSGAAGGMGVGGALYATQGTLNMTNCSILGSAAVGGLGTFAPLNSWVYPGRGGNAFGGGIYMSNITAVLVQVTFTTNRLLSGAAQGTTGMPYGANGGDAVGGAICATNSNVLIANSSIASNNTIAADVANHTLGGGSYSGGGLGGAFWASQGSTVTIQTSSFSNNVAKGGEGWGHVVGGKAMGGAIASLGTLLLYDCALSGNQALAGVSRVGVPGRGGGVYAEGPLTLNRCTFDNNRAIGCDSDIFSQAGPGEGGAFWSSGALFATNCTCATNSAIGGRLYAPGSGGPGRGGAIFTSAGGTLVNLTLAYNRADSQSGISFPGPAQGGGLAVTNSPPTVRGTIIANSSNGGDVWGVVTDGGYNICSDGTAAFTATGSLNNTNPLLGPLAYNGGFTKTIALQPGSPALDRIPSGFPPTDQRGVARPQGLAADVGAYEAQPSPPMLTISRSGSNVLISFNAQGGIMYELLSSANLRNWVSVATNSIPTNGLLIFSQSISSGTGTFYRVVTP